MSTVRICLENDTYQAGDTIRGEAKCYFKSPKTFRKIRIRLQGHESTSWNTRENHYDHSTKQNKRRSVHYSGDHDVLLIDNIAHPEGSLPKGEHIFPICFTLPEDIPSSYHCKNGKIVYTVKVTVDREFKFDFEDIKVFTVIAPIKLQDVDPRMLERAHLSNEKTLCSLWCRGGNIEMQAHLESKAFVVGGSENITVHCLNLSNSDIEAINVELKQTIKCTATHPKRAYKYHQKVIARTDDSGEKTYNFVLEIPSLTSAPNFSRCQFFKSEYTLQVTAIISGCHTNLDVSTDVILGHVPYPGSRQITQEPGTSSSWETMMEYPVNTPMPEPTLVPMPMPMPLNSCGFSVLLYPPSSPLAPSAPQRQNPSAPLLNDFDQINVSLGELPPPSYEEATKGLSLPKYPS